MAAGDGKQTPADMQSRRRRGVLAMSGCPNCGRPTVDGDTICWQCGFRLSFSTAEAAEPRSRAREGWAQPLSLATLGVYAVMTATVIFGFLLLLERLGSYPLAQSGVTDRPPEGWRAFTDAARTFRLHLPMEWNALEAGQPAEQAALAALLAQSEFHGRALEPLGLGVGDLEVMFAATSPETGNGDAPALAVVGRSNELAGLTPEQALALVNDSGLPVLEATYRDNFEKSASFWIVELPLTPEIRCRQYLTVGRRPALLLSVCGPAGRFGAYSATLLWMGESFQGLIAR